MGSRDRVSTNHSSPVDQGVPAAHGGARWWCCCCCCSPQLRWSGGRCRGCRGESECVSIFLNYSFFLFYFAPVKSKLKLQRRGSPGELYSQKTKSFEGNFYFNSEWSEIRLLLTVHGASPLKAQGVKHFIFRGSCLGCDCMFMLACCGVKGTNLLSSLLTWHHNRLVL